MDTDSVRIATGWFIDFVVDIEPEHMAETARSLIRAVMDRGAVEHLAVVDGHASSAGWEIAHDLGSLGTRVSVADAVARFDHPIPAWTTAG